MTLIKFEEMVWTHYPEPKYVSHGIIWIDSANILYVRNSLDELGPVAKTDIVVVNGEVILVAGEASEVVQRIEAGSKPTHLPDDVYRKIKIRFTDI